MLYESIKNWYSTGSTPDLHLKANAFTTNLLLDLMKEDDYEDVDCDLDHIVLEDVLKDLLDEAVNAGSSRTV